LRLVDCGGKIDEKEVITEAVASVRLINCRQLKKAGALYRMA